MSIEIQTVDEHGVAVIKVTGKLTQPELVDAQKSAIRLFQNQKQGKARVLVIAENFQGWAKGGDWGDISQQARFDAHIERMAFVGEKKWRDLALLFTSKGIRKIPIEFFDSADLSKARAWLSGDNLQQTHQP